MPEISNYIRLLFAPLNTGEAGFSSTRYDDRSTVDQTVHIEELKKVNDELRQARRAALNLMEDAILSKEALRQSEEKYRTKLEQDVRDRTAELNATKERLQAILDSSLYVVQAFEAVRDEQGNIIDFTWVMNNRQAIKQSGDLAGKRLLKQSPGILVDGLFEKFVAVTETGITIDHEVYYNHEHFNGWFHQTLVKSGDGFVMNTQNITEKRNAQEEILWLKDEVAQKATDKYLTLFNNMQQGFSIIKVVFNKAGTAVDYKYVETNPAFEKKTSLKDVTGKMMRQLQPRHEEHWFQIFGDVVKTGKPIHFENEAAHLGGGLWFEVYAFPSGNAGDGQVAVLLNDITDRKKAEKALRESQVHKEFLLKLNDTLRDLSDPVEIQYQAARLVGEQLEADRVHFAEISEEEKLVIRKDYVRGKTRSIAGTIDPLLLDATLKLSRDEPLVIDDIEDFPHLSPEEKAAFAEAKIRSQLSVGLSRKGKKVASFAVDHNTPRDWAPLEISILQEAAERTLAAVEKAKAEEALRESEALLAKELEDTKQLQKISSRIIEEGDVSGLYHALIESAMEITHSDFASIQILSPDNAQLLLHAWKGFHPKSAEYWKEIGEESTTACGKAFAERKRIVVPNVEKWAEVSKEDLKEFRRSGIVAIQSTPLITRTGKIVGILSTHWKQVHEPLERELGLVEVIARQAADLIDRKQAEDALRESEDFRVLADAVPQLIWTNTADSKANYFNKRWYEYTGLTYQQSVEAGWEAIVHPDEEEVSVKKWNEAVTTGAVFDTEYRLRGRDGQYQWFIGRNVPMKNEAGKVTGWFGSATDIESRKRTEAALSESEARLKITMESATDYAIITTNTERRIERWSSGATQTFGYTEAEVIGQPSDIIFTEEDKAAGVPEKEMETAKTKGRAADERWHERKDGNRFFGSGVMRPIHNNGVISGYVKVLRDMTQQQMFTEELHRLVQKRTAELQRSNEDLAKFAHVASHDLREPVRKIKTFNNRIIDDFNENLPDRVKTYLHKIGNAADRMYSMIEGVLSYSKLGNAEEPRESVNLNEVINEIENDLEVLIQQKKAEITTKDLPDFPGYRVLLYQLFYNLILNSLKFAKNSEPSRIQIKCDLVEEDSKQWYKIVLEDNGIGFEQEYALSIFGTFTRLNPADQYEGTGLGLALCKKIVERHHGSISASGELDKGATFTILLPVE